MIKGCYLRPKLRYTLLLLSSLSLHGSELKELFETLAPSRVIEGAAYQKAPYRFIKEKPFVTDPFLEKSEVNPSFADYYAIYHPNLAPLQVVYTLSHEYEWADDLLLLKSPQQRHEKRHLLCEATLSFHYECGPLFVNDDHLPQLDIDPQEEKTFLSFHTLPSLSVRSDSNPLLALLCEEELISLSSLDERAPFLTHQKIAPLFDLLPSLLSLLELYEEVDKEAILTSLTPNSETAYFEATLATDPHLFKMETTLVKPSLLKEGLPNAVAAPLFSHMYKVYLKQDNYSLPSDLLVSFRSSEKEPSLNNLDSVQESLPTPSISATLSFSECNNEAYTLSPVVTEESLSIVSPKILSHKPLLERLMHPIDATVLKQALTFFFKKQSDSDKKYYLARTATPGWEKSDEISFGSFSESFEIILSQYERDYPHHPLLQITALKEAPFLKLSLSSPKSELPRTAAPLLQSSKWLTYIKQEQEPSFPHFLTFPSPISSRKTPLSISPRSQSSYFETTAPQSFYLSYQEPPLGEAFRLSHCSAVAPAINFSLLDPAEIAEEFLFIEEHSTVLAKAQEAHNEFSPDVSPSLISLHIEPLPSTHAEIRAETGAQIEAYPLMLGSLVEKTTLVFSKTLLAPEEYELKILSMLDALTSESPFEASPESSSIALCYDPLDLPSEKEDNSLLSTTFLTEEDKEGLNALLIKKWGRIVYGSEKHKLFAYVKGESVATDNLPQLLEDSWALESPLSYRDPDAEQTFVSQKRVNVEDLKNAFGAPLPGYRTLTSATIADAFEPLIVAIKPWGNHERHARINKTYRKLSTDYLDYPTLEELDTISLSDPFETYVEYVPDKNRGGYLFSIELKLSKQFTCSAENQHYLFLVDRSKAVESHRYEVFKSALLRSLGYLKKGDTFNIAVYDSRLKLMAEEPLEISENNKAKAKYFLTEEKHAGLFKPTDIYDLLLKTKAEAASRVKPTNVILMTDGSTISDLRTKRRETQRLISEPLSNYALYIATCCNRDNLPFTELLCTWNKGEALFSPTNASFSRKFAGLIRRISHPVAGNIALTPLVKAGQNKVTFFNVKSYDHPNLYAENPLKLYGHIDKIEDFNLCLQGTTNDRQFLNITQEVSFSKALRVGRGLRKEIAKKETLPYYLKYLDTGELSHLEKAYNITKSFEIDLPHKWE